MIFTAVILALLAAGVGYLYLQDAVEKADPLEKAPVVLAKAAIPEKTLIKREMVEQVQVPVDFIHPRALRSLDDVIGKIAREQIVAGEQVLRDRIVQTGEAKSGLCYQIPPGKRAFTVAVDEVAAVGWHLKPGDHVDILAIVDVPGKGKVSVVILQDIPVLAVGKKLESACEQGKEANDGVKTVTLAVSLQETTPLFLASEGGKVRFALRSPVGREQQAVIPFELNNFLPAN